MSFVACVSAKTVNKPDTDIALYPVGLDTTNSLMAKFKNYTTSD